jgi:hypothetical protein
MRTLTSQRRWIAGWVLAASVILPQVTCTLDAPAGGRILVDPDSAIIVADLIRDIVYIRNADDDHHHHHGDFFFYDWWY